MLQKLNVRTSIWFGLYKIRLRTTFILPIIHWLWLLLKSKNQEVLATIVQNRAETGSFRFSILIKEWKKRFWIHYYLAGRVILQDFEPWQILLYSIFGRLFCSHMCPNISNRVDWGWATESFHRHWERMWGILFSFLYKFVILFKDKLFAFNSGLKQFFLCNVSGRPEEVM